MRLTTLAACALLIAAGANTASAQQRLTDQVMKDARTYGTKTEAELREDRIKLEKFEAVFKEGKALQDAGDVAGAIRIFEEASSAGWADATWRLSSLYEKGEIVPRDADKAKALWSLAYKQREAATEAKTQENRLRQERLGAMVKQGQKALDAGDIDAALRSYQAASNEGSGVASLYLARLYDRGEVVPRDLAKAQAFYLKASTGNYGIGNYTVSLGEKDQDRVAALYCSGAGLYPNDGLVRDAAKGWEMVRDTFKNTRPHEMHVESGWIRYVCYARTENPDPKKAEEVLSAAANYNKSGLRGSDVDNIRNLKVVQDEQYNKTFEFKLYDRTGALTRYGKDAEAGDAKAQRALYQAYSEGRGAPQDRTKAFEWAMKAAQQGDAIAQAIVGETYLNGYVPVERDTKAAMTWLQKSAEAGQWSAAFMLADIYKKGAGVKVDQRQAQAWLKRCAALGGDPCQNVKDETPSALQKAFQK